MLRARLITPPAAYVLSLAEARSHSRIDAGEDDADLAAYIAAAVAYLDGIDGILGRALLAQTWIIETDRIPGDMVRLPLDPVISIDGVGYYDAADAPQVFASSSYRLHHDARGPYLRLASGASWPTTAIRDDAIGITFTAGHASPGAVPETIRQAIRLLTAHFYENREPVLVGVSGANLAHTLDMLIGAQRRRRLVGGPYV